MLTVRCSVLLLALTACASPPPLATEQIAAVDVAFGAGLVDRVFDAPNAEVLGDPSDRARFRMTTDGSARDRAKGQVDQSLDADVRSSVATFLATPAGQALCRAEASAVTAYPHLDGDFFGQSGRHFGDPASVDASARAMIADAQRAMKAGASVSPLQLAIVLAAAQITPAQAESIAAFCQTPAGQSWQRSRADAVAETSRRFWALRGEATEAGFVRYSGEDLEDLVLPRR